MTKEKSRNEAWAWSKALIIAVALAAVIRYFLFAPIVVDGESMMPTLLDGDRMIVNKLSYLVGEPERFDIVVFHAPEGKDYIKRVIGLPGDHIAYEDDILYVNGEALEEPYLDEYKEQLPDNGLLTYNFTLESITDYEVIPEGYLFVLGDNRRETADSRDPRVGLVPMEKVLGKAHFRIYPFDNVGIVK